MDSDNEKTKSTKKEIKKIIITKTKTKTHKKNKEKEGQYFCSGWLTEKKNPFRSILAFLSSFIFRSSIRTSDFINVTTAIGISSFFRRETILSSREKQKKKREKQIKKGEQKTKESTRT